MTTTSRLDYDKMSVILDIDLLNVMTNGVHGCPSFCSEYFVNLSLSTSHNFTISSNWANSSKFN